MEFKMKFDREQVDFTVPDENVLQEILPRSVETVRSEEEEVRRALSQPIGTGRLGDVVRPGETVAVITSDVTRPMPSHIVLPLVLRELNDAGIRDEDILVVFGLGSHRRQSEEEKKRLVGEDVYRRVRCIDSDVNDCVRLGMCTHGTPVDVFRPVAEADRRILLGNVEFHYFAGYSGGYKAIMPGVSSHDAIQENHKNMVKAGSYAGNTEGNPVREDMEETARFITADFIVNVVLDDHKKIAYAAAGHPQQAHKKACEFLDGLYKVRVKGQADVVIVSAGGFPKDINLYQAQKAIDNAKRVVKDGGILIAVGACREGYGSDVFARWIETYPTPIERIHAIRKHFELGGHKAAALAQVQERAEIWLVTAMDEELVKKVNMRPFHSVQEAVNAALAAKGKDASVYVIPVGGSTLPFPEE